MWFKELCFELVPHDVALVQISMGEEFWPMTMEIEEIGEERRGKGSFHLMKISLLKKQVLKPKFHIERLEVNKQIISALTNFLFHPGRGESGRDIKSSLFKSKRIPPEGTSSYFLCLWTLQKPADEDLPTNYSRVQC